jgi:broad specificity phosphatase PhoE
MIEEPELRKIILVRHGTTDWVEQQILHGITDISLNKMGLAQAGKAAKALTDSGAQKIYSSSLTRCVQTANAIGNQLNREPVLMDSLVELDFGWLEGRHFRDHDKGEFGKLTEFFDSQIFNLIRMLSGEPKQKFMARILAGWNRILNENSEGTVIVVGHSGVFSRILQYLFGEEYLKKGDSYYHLNPCSITEIQINDDNHMELIRLNDRSHLSEKNR